MILHGRIRHQAPFLGKIEPVDPFPDALQVDFRSGDVEHRTNVSQMLVGATESVILQLLHDQLLGRGEDRRQARQSGEATTALDLAPATSSFLSEKTSIFRPDVGWMMLN